MSKNEPASDKADARQDAQITQHYEPERQGGRQYLRCEGCGREVIGRDEGRLLHAEGCPRRDGR